MHFHRPISRLSNQRIDHHRKSAAAGLEPGRSGLGRLAGRQLEPEIAGQVEGRNSRRIHLRLAGSWVGFQEPGRLGRQMGCKLELEQVLELVFRLELVLGTIV
jgi:hypothetical protein